MNDRTNTQTVMTSGDLPTYTSLEVAKHNTREDAWIIVGRKVLDVTHWLDEHPGGDVVLLDAAGKRCVSTQAEICICIIAHF